MTNESNKNQSKSKIKSNRKITESKTYVLRTPKGMITVRRRRNGY